MVTMFYSWAPFPERLGSMCEEQRGPGVEGLRTVTATRHLHQPSVGAILGGVGDPECLSLRESVSSRPCNGPPSLPLGSEERLFLLVLEP